MRGQRPQRRPAFQQADGQGCGAEAAHGERGGDREGFNSADAIAKPKAKGVPASKLLLGIGFYGRGWTGVTQSAPGGTAKGTVGGTAYAHCGNDWWSYDTPATVG
ncbi:Chitinase (EC, partial [Streptomyces globisporus]